ncbi:DNA-binding anti-repressor SinI [Bacillus sp. JCM 19034]|nr:DNA-binding anti-repressor SinI [Bacillus sp. JCM 19034]
MSKKQEYVDLEWLELLLEAKMNGLTVEEVQSFFSNGQEDKL